MDEDAKAKQQFQELISQLPPQQSAADTSIWDDREVKSPDGEINIRTTDDE
jgi:hypothetical protein